MKMNWILLVGFVLGCNLIGALGAIWTSSDSDWYRNLNKPSFNPPSWVFGPVWTLLFFDGCCFIFGLGFARF